MSHKASTLTCALCMFALLPLLYLFLPFMLMKIRLLWSFLLVPALKGLCLNNYNAAQHGDWEALWVSGHWCISQPVTGGGSCRKLLFFFSMFCSCSLLLVWQQMRRITSKIGDLLSVFRWFLFLTCSVVFSMFDKKICILLCQSCFSEHI